MPSAWQKKLEQAREVEKQCHPVLSEKALRRLLQVELYEIGAAMKVAKLPNEFIAAAMKTASEFDGVYDLMRMWHEETDSAERERILADLQDMIDDCAGYPHLWKNLR